MANFPSELAGWLSEVAVNKTIQARGYIRPQSIKEESDPQKLPKATQGCAELEENRKL